MLDELEDMLSRVEAALEGRGSQSERVSSGEETDGNWIASIWRKGAAVIVAALNTSRELDAIISLDLASERQHDDYELNEVWSTNAKLLMQARSSQRAVRRCVEDLADSGARALAHRGEAARALQLQLEQCESSRKQLIRRLQLNEGMPEDSREMSTP